MQSDENLQISYLPPSFSCPHQLHLSPPYQPEHPLKSGKSSTASTTSLNNTYSCHSVDPTPNPSPLSLSHTRTPAPKRRESQSHHHCTRLPKALPAPCFITPTRALLDYFEFLTEYEREEISFYDEIYFVGAESEKNRGKAVDEEGFYKAVIGDHLAFRYEIKEFLGSGVFGHVFRCYDYKRQIEVAVKIIRNSQLYREAGDLENKILHELAKADPNDSNCIIKKLRSFEFRGHLCLVFELLSLNLYQFLHKNNFQGLSLPLIRRISVQIFMALKTVHSAGIIHCDMKPDNILLKFENKSSVKVIDFGSACQEGRKVFDYVQSRYYRAPEIVLEAGYDRSIDIWSMGCILYELLTGTALFPAESEEELFQMYVEVLGAPPVELLVRGKRRNHYIDGNGKVRRCCVPKSRPLSVLLEAFDEKIVDLVQKCLRWMPEERILAEVGLMHAWVRGQKN